MENEEVKKTKFNRTYSLTVMFPSSGGGGKYYQVDVEANDYTINSAGAYVFIANRITIATYPIQYTIIEKIVKHD